MHVANLGSYSELIHNRASTDSKFYSFASVYAQCRHLGLLTLGYWGCSDFLEALPSEFQIQILTWNSEIPISDSFRIAALFHQ